MSEGDRRYAALGSLGMAKVQRAWRGPRGPYAGTAARKEEILQAAVEVFGSRGFRNGSLREIAERVDLTQAGLFHHFGSKLGLFMEVLHTHALNAMKVQRSLPFKEEILAVVEDSENNRDYLRLFTTISSESTDPNHPAHDYFVTRYREVRERWRTSIEQEQRNGSIDPNVDADAAAQLIIAALDGLNIQWLLGTSEEMRGPVEYLLSVLLPSDRVSSGDNGRTTGGPEPDNTKVRSERRSGAKR
jgi:AcrR family transcriptional regulator